MDRPVALITGGAKRVGRAIALHLARSGFDVAITYLNSAPEARSTVSEIRDLGAAAVAIQADLTDLSVIGGLISSLSAFSPRLDALVNSASIYRPDSGDMDADAQLFRIHVQAPLVLSKQLAPMLKTSRGCIVNMCDILGERPMAGWLSYCASKAAMANLTLGLARELAPEVRVCGVAPGVAQWPDDYTQEQKLSYLKKVPLGRPGTPEEVAKLVHFLLVDGKYITGQIIRLDGGRSITW